MRISLDKSPDEEKSLAYITCPVYTRTLEWKRKRRHKAKVTGKEEAMGLRENKAAAAPEQTGRNGNHLG